MNIIDLLAIAPFYIAVGMNLSFLRTLRLLRMFRLFKLARYSQAIRLLGEAFRRVGPELAMTGFVAAIAVVVAASALYFAEHDSQPEVYSSIPASLWWAVVTLTTVGSERQSILERCRSGEQLILRHDPDNAYSICAVQVLRTNGEQLGYAPGYLGERICDELEDSFWVLGVLAEVTGGTWSKPTRGANFAVFFNENEGRGIALAPREKDAGRRDNCHPPTSDTLTPDRCNKWLSVQHVGKPKSAYFPRNSVILE